MRFILLVACLVLSNTGISQQVRYVTDTLYVNLRNGQSSQDEVLRSAIVSGTPLTLIEESGDNKYSLVRTEDGIEGWLQSQYLLSSPIAKDQLINLEQALLTLNQDNSFLREQLGNIDLPDKAEESTVPFQEDLRLSNIDSVEFQPITQPLTQPLTTNNQVLIEQNQILKNQLEVAQTEADILQDRISNNNFWNAALAILIGVLMTLVIPRLWPNKRSEWV